ncbi:MAG: hypothetical protein ACO3SO_07060 [Luteolibacter sp.]
MLKEVTSQRRLIARRNFFNFIHQWFEIQNLEGNVLIYTKMRAFKLKEDIRVLGPDKQTELLSIRARQVLDFGATYDVTDTSSGEKLGALRRKGMKSLIKDEWLILNANDEKIGLITEDSGGAGHHASSGGRAHLPVCATGAQWFHWPTKGAQLQTNAQSIHHQILSRFLVRYRRDL